IAFVRSPDGRLDRSGGWGYLLGDEGSAYGLSLAGLRAVVRSADGCLPPARLTQSLLSFMGFKEPLEMIRPSTATTGTGPASRRWPLWCSQPLMKATPLRSTSFKMRLTNWRRLRSPLRES